MPAWFLLALAWLVALVCSQQYLQLASFEQCVCTGPAPTYSSACANIALGYPAPVCLLGTSASPNTSGACYWASSCDLTVTCTIARPALCDCSSLPIPVTPNTSRILESLVCDWFPGSSTSPCGCRWTIASVGALPQNCSQPVFDTTAQACSYLSGCLDSRAPPSCLLSQSGLISGFCGAQFQSEDWASSVRMCVATLIQAVSNQPAASCPAARLDLVSAFASCTRIYDICSVPYRDRAALLDATRGLGWHALDVLSFRSLLGRCPSTANAELKLSLDSSVSANSILQRRSSILQQLAGLSHTSTDHFVLFIPFQSGKRQAASVSPVVLISMHFDDRSAAAVATYLAEALSYSGQLAGLPLSKAAACNGPCVLAGMTSAGARRAASSFLLVLLFLIWL
jgi:hypothetical protein